MNLQPKELMDKAFQFYSEKNYHQSIKQLEILISQFPLHPDVNYLYATVLSLTDNFELSIKHFLIALKTAPQNANCWSDLGNAYNSVDDNTNAINCFEKCLSIAPDHIHALHNLAQTLNTVGSLKRALSVALKAIALKPKSVDIMFLLGNIYKNLGDNDKAIHFYHQTLQHSSSYFKASFNIALIEKNKGNYEVALKQCNTTLEINPIYIQALMLKGEINEYFGDIDISINCYKEALRITPNYTKAYWSLANLSNYYIEDSILQNMLKVSETSINKNSRMYLYFSIAKAMEDRKEHGLSFDYLIKANKLKREQVQYSSNDIRDFFSKLKQSLTSEKILKSSSDGYKEISPIFVVGMARSGTSLVEQILSSHSDIEGGGELLTSQELLFDALPKLTGLSWTESLQKLDRKTLCELGHFYHKKHSDLINKQLFFTDKLPFNFALIGFLSLVFPKAKFIHIYKHPMDSCLSCFKQLFNSGQDYSYDFEELSDYYLYYQDIMDYWSKVTSDKIHHVSYEELVDSPRKLTMNILKFLSIEWDESCINFHKQRRIVRTASASQVREKINNKSIGRWTNYKDELQPFMNKLSKVPTSFNLKK